METRRERVCCVWRQGERVCCVCAECMCSVCAECMNEREKRTDKEFRYRSNQQLYSNVTLWYQSQQTNNEA